MPSEDTKTPPPPPATKPATVDIKPQLPEFPPNRIVREGDDPAATPTAPRRTRIPGRY